MTIHLEYFKLIFNDQQLLEASDLNPDELAMNYSMGNDDKPEKWIAVLLKISKTKPITFSNARKI
ncbi:MAG: hypothetical protein JW866_07350 [Ignavibacteriales bacterium]|nr:hypothetical protein [Ignavibacteriales bacterium]